MWTQGLKKKKTNKNILKAFCFLIFKQVWLIPQALFTTFSIELNVFGKKETFTHGDWKV